MRLIKVTARGAGLFEGEEFSMDLFAADRVDGKAGPLFNDVHRLGSVGSIYSQNVVAISGVNASGKSTALKLLRSVLEMLVAPTTMRCSSPASFVPAKMRKRFETQITFWEDSRFYLLESTLRIAKATDGGTPRWFRIDDEELWVLDTRRPNKAMMRSADVFKRNAHVLLRRNAHASDDAAIPSEARRFLLGNVSIASAVIAHDEAGEDYEVGSVLRAEHTTDIVHAFDCSIERLEWDPEAEVFRLKFFGEDERLVGARSVEAMLSDGTIVGVGMVERALEQLRIGGFVLIDEIEHALNKSLVRAFIELFQSHVTNPHGAQLIFTTHYIELLDYLPRKDNVYLLVRNGEHQTEVVKYSDRISRIENKKSEVVLANAIRGAMPSYPEVEGMRAYAREYVHG